MTDRHGSTDDHQVGGRRRRRVATLPPLDPRLTGRSDGGGDPAGTLRGNHRDERGGCRMWIIHVELGAHEMFPQEVRPDVTTGDQLADSGELRKSHSLDRVRCSNCLSPHRGGALQPELQLTS